MVGKIDSQLLKGVLTGAILQLLAQEELYGYGLSQRLAEVGFTDISNGTIYPLLLSLEKKQMIEGDMRTSESGPKRKYYTITAIGEEELRTFKLQWRQLQGTMSHLIGGESE